MPNYKKMYFKLFCAHCDVIELLQKASGETEQLAMGATDLVDLQVELSPKNSNDETEK